MGISRTDAHGLRTICARSHHRSKTHLPYFVWIIDSTTKLWKTPHGLWRIVDHHGTHHPEIIELHPDLTVA